MEGGMEEERKGKRRREITNESRMVRTTESVGLLCQEIRVQKPLWRGVLAKSN